MSLAAEIRDKAVALWHLQRIRKLVRERAQLGAHALVSVIELPCVDPACPDRATQITVLGFDLMRRVGVVHRSVSEITVADIDSIRLDLMTAHVN